MAVITERSELFQERVLRAGLAGLAVEDDSAPTAAIPTFTLTLTPRKGSQRGQPLAIVRPAGLCCPSCLARGKEQVLLSTFAPGQGRCPRCRTLALDPHVYADWLTRWEARDQSAARAARRGSATARRQEEMRRQERRLAAQMLFIIIISASLLLLGVLLLMNLLWTGSVPMFGP